MNVTGFKEVSFVLEKEILNFILQWRHGKFPSMGASPLIQGLNQGVYICKKLVM